MKTKILGMEREIKVYKKGDYFKVFDIKNNCVMATYSLKTQRMWGATAWFLFKLHPDFKKYY
jgi:hypothetical protein